MPSLNETTERLAGGVAHKLQHVSQNRRGLWLAGGMELLGLLVFVGFFNIVAPNLDNRLHDWQLIVIGVLLSLIPALLWLLFFYQLDRLEPEPKRKLIDVFIIAGLLSAGMAYPLLHTVFEIDSWMYDWWWTQLLGGILVVGILQTLAVYLALRYGIYFDPEFDERVDGVIYGTAAGLGVATVLNFVYIFQHGGVDLDVGSMRMVINALAYASFAGILGYCLGQTRFEKTPFYYLPFGFLLAATLNGLFFFLTDRVSWQGLQTNNLNGLILATIFALMTLVVLFWLVHRADEETLRVGRSPVSKPVRAPAPVSAPVAPRSPEPPPSPSPAPIMPVAAVDVAPPVPRPTVPPPPLPAPVRPPEPSPAPPPAALPVKAPALPTLEASTLEEEGFPNSKEILADVKASWQALLHDLQNDAPDTDEERP
ncbi:MAG: PrsW family intramembrane metalloprotease [Chloroflexi bacterium]|nr:PrsW family intramembrane metalloprotease [Chloroflexota bacterium]